MDVYPARRTNISILVLGILAVMAGFYNSATCPSKWRKMIYEHVFPPFPCIYKKKNIEINIKANVSSTMQTRFC